MAGSRAHVGEAEPFQNHADLTLAIFNAEAPFHNPLELTAPPAHDAVPAAIRPRPAEGRQLRTATTP